MDPGTPGQPQAAQGRTPGLPGPAPQADIGSTPQQPWGVNAAFPGRGPGGVYGPQADQGQTPGGSAWGINPTAFPGRGAGGVYPQPR